MQKSRGASFFERRRVSKRADECSLLRDLVRTERIPTADCGAANMFARVVERFANADGALGADFSIRDMGRIDVCRTGPSVFVHRQHVLFVLTSVTVFGGERGQNDPTSRDANGGGFF